MTGSPEGLVLSPEQIAVVAAFLSSDGDMSLTIGPQDDREDGFFILERKGGRSAVYLPVLDQLLFFKGVTVRRAEADVRLFFQFEGFDIGVLADPSIEGNPLEGFRDASLDGRCWIGPGDVCDTLGSLGLTDGVVSVGAMIDMGFTPEPVDGEGDPVYGRSLGPAVRYICTPAWPEQHLDVREIYSYIDFAWACNLGGPLAGLTFGLDGGFELFIRASKDTEEGAADGRDCRWPGRPAIP